MADLNCSVCGNDQFNGGPVLWPALIAEWQLSAEEVRYVDRQQGWSCTSCGANLRFIVLGKAILALAGTDSPLRDAIADGAFQDWRVLDCNGAGPVSDALAVLPHYLRADFPEYDMRRMPFGDGSFDLIIHSDTLEHVEHPIVALEECRRLLSPSGHLCFTVPIIVGRRSRSREGLFPSYHGDPATERADFVVHTEFGADAWTMVFEAGFTGVKLTQVDFPSAIAITASKGAPVATAQVDHHEQLEAASERAPETVLQAAAIYDQDGLRSIHNHEFLEDPVFQAAYDRGVQAAGCDYMWHWRVHVGLWAAATASKLSGDFAEFGVNRGFLSSAIMRMLNWNALSRTFYLLDTFAGVDERYINDEDRQIGVIERNRYDIEIGFYTFDVDAVRANFAEWPSARVIVGPVPETLPQIDSSQFAFAHIDMNCAPPEVAAAEFLWPRMVPGAIILLDDYAYDGYRSQKLAMDEFARSKDVSILSLPTGQGLIIKPA
jgi:hypothetical protein